MRIIGGSFGTRGKIDIGKHGITVRGARTLTYLPSQLATLHARRESERRFAVLTFLLGLIIFGGLGFLFLGPLGLIIALVLCIVGSFYRRTNYYTDLVFTDGNSVTVETTRRQADQLAELK
ncbi:hypothetical protein FHR95_002292 [Halomonas fontilapidosi]|uniref:Uncharacterized protein n=1 Tax=Halomonas fontilapidosi TaxID=616675 RepID=A0A7W5DLE7_9GAMM|nr:hypothetical protein [Halomonas fontilapidosi]MBB3184718.1 hypothetical protein [Halomonas fontilapidosi]